MLAVVALAALAGCGGLAGGEAGAQTVTPATVPDPALPGDEAAGSDGVDGLALVERHQGATMATSYTLVETFRVGPIENASYHQRVLVRTTPNHEPFFMHERTRADPPSEPSRNVSVWWDGDMATYKHVFTAERNTTFRISEDPTPRIRLGGQTAVLLGSLSITAVERGPNETTIVAGTVEQAALVPVVDGIDAVRNATMTIRVRSDGIIDRVAVGYDARYFGDGPYRVRYAYRITDVGTTTVEPPDWVRNFRRGAG